MIKSFLYILTLLLIINTTLGQSKTVIKLNLDSSVKWVYITDREMYLNCKKQINITHDTLITITEKDFIEHQYRSAKKEKRYFGEQIIYLLDDKKQSIRYYKVYLAF
jgi:hypothetical protein